MTGTRHQLAKSRSGTQDHWWWPRTLVPLWLGTWYAHWATPFLRHPCKGVPIRKSPLRFNGNSLWRLTGNLRRRGPMPSHVPFLVTARSTSQRAKAWPTLKRQQAKPALLQPRLNRTMLHHQLRKRCLARRLLGALPRLPFQRALPDRRALRRCRRTQPHRLPHRLRNRSLRKCRALSRCTRALPQRRPR